jgi:hypothetical protein
LELVSKLFVEWSLETWANVLEIVGFIVALSAFIISLVIKSEIGRLKTSYIFDKTIKRHIENLKASASTINQLLNDYDTNRSLIRTELGNCISELEDISQKVSFSQAGKCRRLVRFLKRRRTRQFVLRKIHTNILVQFIMKRPRRLIETSYDDVWEIYDRLIEVIRQMENIKLNKNKSL